MVKMIRVKGSRRARAHLRKYQYGMRDYDPHKNIKGIYKKPVRYFSELEERKGWI